ncbi:MAG: A/G-specific adenine glycosylase [Acidobacteriota bacterium]
MRSFADRLLGWFEEHRRDLPWRHRRDPYAVLVSEVMLQQTTVAAATPYFERFLAALPDFEALASAETETVLELWSGLGYYRRARRLQETARAVLDEHQGHFPDRLDQALELPGIGPYTAGAILSLAHGKAVPAVDGNVGRVLSRHLGEALDATRVRDRRRLEEVVLERMPADRPGPFTEALMELGALCCRPQGPACDGCPVRADCIARRDDRVAELPPPRKRSATRSVEAVAAVIRRDDGAVLLRRRPEDAALLAGLWEPPSELVDDGGATEAVLQQVLDDLGGGAMGEELFTLRHAITNRRIRVHVHACTLTTPPAESPTLAWRHPTEATDLALTATAARLVKKLPAAGPRPRRQGA